MGRTIEEIILSLSAETKGINDLISGLDKTKASLRETAKQAFIAERNMFGFGEVLKMDRKEFRQFHEFGGKMKTFGGRVAFGLRKATAGLGGFKMEMLSVMFFGLGIKNFFMGLISPALEMAGVFDILRTALGILFLPLALVVLDWALKFLDIVTNMPPWLQKLINWIAGLGVIFGTILFVVGSVVLGLGGLITAFGGIIAVAVGVGAAVLAFIATPLGIALLALLAIAASNETGNQKWGELGNVWDRLKSLGSGLLDTVFQTFLNWFPSIRDLLEDMGIHTQSFGDAWTDVKAKFDKWLDKWKSEHPWLVIDILRLWYAVTDFVDGIIAIGVGIKNAFSEENKKLMRDVLAILMGIVDSMKWIKENAFSGPITEGMNPDLKRIVTKPRGAAAQWLGDVARAPLRLVVEDRTKGGINATSSDTIFEAERGVVR